MLYKAGKRGYRLVETSPVNSYHDPLAGVLEVWLLEFFDVFISMKNQP